MPEFNPTPLGSAHRPSAGEFNAPFAFSGVLHQVVVELADDQHVDAAGELPAALRQQ